MVSLRVFVSSVLDCSFPFVSVYVFFVSAQSAICHTYSPPHIWILNNVSACQKYFLALFTEFSEKLLKTKLGASPLHRFPLGSLPFHFQITKFFCYCCLCCHSLPCLFELNLWFICLSHSFWIYHRRIFANWPSELAVCGSPSIYSPWRIRVSVVYSCLSEPLFLAHTYWNSSKGNCGDFAYILGKLRSRTKSDPKIWCISEIFQIALQAQLCSWMRKYYKYLIIRPRNGQICFWQRSILYSVLKSNLSSLDCTFLWFLIVFFLVI